MFGAGFSPRTRCGLVPLLLLAAVSATAHDYRIEVTADASLSVHGVVTLEWRNETGQPVSAIPLRHTGRFGKASVGGQPIRLTGGRAVLPAPLAPQSSATLRIEFSSGARGAYGYRMLTGPWHPKAVTFRNGAFQEKQEQADGYEVTLTAPDRLVVAAAGESLETPAAGEGKRRYRWRLPCATSFGLAASPDFTETKRTSEGVEVRLYELRGETRFDAAFADFAVDAIAFYKRTFGFYPQPALVLLPGQMRSGGGYAPASGFTVYHRNTGEYRQWMVAHEIGHQYFGFDTLIDDGDFQHWPGIALGMYADQLYTSARRNERFTPGFGAYRQALGKGFDTTILRPKESLKGQKFDWNSGIYHYKAWAVVSMLSDLIGPERFLDLLRRLLHDGRCQCLTPERFQREVETAAGHSLDWFFADWVRGGAHAGFAIESVASQDGTLQAVVRRTGAARFPVEVQLTTADGAEQVLRLAYDAEVQTLRFPLTAAPKRLQIDPRGRCPIVKSGKEVWQPD